MGQPDNLEKKPAVLHINLARGWRGGEQQTWLLIRELSEAGYRQGLCGYADAPLVERVKALDNVTVVQPHLCFLWPWGAAQWSVAHAHEGRGVYLAWWLKKTLGLPYLVTRRMQHPPKPRVLTKAVYRGADALVGISSAACRALESFVPNREVNRIPSVYSGEKASPAAASAIRQWYVQGADSILVGHAGALVDREKGQSILIKACKQLRNIGYPIVLVLLGEGSDRGVFEQETRFCDWAHMPGHVDRVQDYFSAFDLFVFPSRHEGLGSVLLEAMAAKCAVVSTDVGGIPDIVRHNETGRLVPSGDADSLAAVIREAVDAENETKRMVANALSLVEQQFSAPAMASRYSTSYQVIGQKTKLQ
ncbi:glycosyltransferase family 4 protein [Spiribacter sp. 218]|uniref:glycosyltransferase family 4 protein n=1 Tax=Spiribacter pallidus TaxID=1987936 RepID=UPI00349F6915